MRLIRITTNYPAYLRQFYGDRPGLEQSSYERQYRALVADCYGWADFWTHAFGALGYEVWEPVGNAEPMQKAWACEHGVPYDEETWLTDIVTAQVKHFRPDVVFVNDYATYSATFFRHLRSECPSIRFVMGWCGAPYKDERVFAAYDVVLSNIPGLVQHFRDTGHQSRLMRHAFEPRVLEQLGKSGAPATLFSFVGSIAKGEGRHNQREQLLRHLLQQTNLQIWSEIRRPSAKQVRRFRLRQGAYDAVQAAGRVPGLKQVLPLLPRVRNYHALEQRPTGRYVDPVIAAQARPGLFGLAMYRQLRDSKVSLNTHIDIAASYASNMRLFEATGVGTCLLTEAQPDLHELFESDLEVVTYRSADEAVEKVRYLLDHEEERQQIARAGQQRTLRDHTMDLRAQQLDVLIREWAQ